MSCPLAANASASCWNSTGSSTTPLPMILILPPWKIPDGIERSTYFSPLNSSVWPAFGPPWKRVMTSYFGVRTSTTLPLPSSPHCNPNNTSTDFMIGVCGYFYCCLFLFRCFFCATFSVRPAYMTSRCRRHRVRSKQW